MPPPSLFLPTPALPTSRPHSSYRRPRGVQKIAPIASRKPPPVKQGFYKNPSKAIEKGGGFYIPGLRGPRLRVAVSGVAATLLTLNHVSGGVGVGRGSLYVSEILAGAAVVMVLGTAVLDIAAERGEVKGMEGTEVYVEGGGSGDVDAGDTPRVGGEVAEVVGWVESMAADLCGVSMVAVCRDGEVIYGRGVVDGVGEAGEVVRRVGEGGRVFYVEDVGALPEEATVPFLERAVDGKWAVVFVPVGRQVVAFGKVGGGLEVADRAWLVQMAARVAGGCA